MNDNPVQVHLGNCSDRVREESFLEGRVLVQSPRGVNGSERLLFEALDQKLDGRVLVAGAREAALAIAASQLHPSTDVHAIYFDAHDYACAVRNRSEQDAPRVSLDLAPTLVERADDGSQCLFDHVILSFNHASDAQLGAEMVRQAHRSLKPRGKLLAAIDSRRTSWLHKRILESFGAATIHHTSRRGAVYVARKRPDFVPRERNPSRRFDATLFGQTLTLETAPGVFSHGALDEGTLALSEVIDLPPKARVVDIGCGCGALGIAAALSTEGGQAILADSSARAVAATRKNVLANGAARNAAVILSYNLQALAPASLDVALANPPYYGDFRISEHFTREAFRALKTGGKFALVTKARQPNVDIVQRCFGNHDVAERRGYDIVRAVRRA